ncbi:hypothetical protein [Streptomyces sp. NPDC056194]
MCERSAHDHPHLVAAATGHEPADVTCGGATTDTVTAWSRRFNTP